MYLTLYYLAKMQQMLSVNSAQEDIYRGWQRESYLLKNSPWVGQVPLGNTKTFHFQLGRYTKTCNNFRLKKSRFYNQVM